MSAISNVNGNAAAQETLTEKLAAAKEASTNASTNASADKTNSASAVVKSDSVQISEEAKQAEKTTKTRRTRLDKAEKATRADKAEKTTRAKRADVRVEKAGKQVSATEKVSKRDSTFGIKKAGMFDSNVLKAKTKNLSMVFSGLSKMGISAKEVSKVVQKANRNMNEKLGNDLKQAYTDYKEKKISSDEFKSRLYEAATKKVQGIASALRNAYSQKTAPAANNNGATTPSSDNKESSKTAKAPRESIFAKMNKAKEATAPSESIFAKKDNAQTTPTVKKDEPTLIEEAAARNKEKSEEAKAAAKAEEKTAMAAKPVIEEDAKIREKRGNIAEDVGDHVTTTTEKTVANSALATGKTNPEVKDTLGDDDDDDKKVAPGLEKKEELPPGLAMKEDDDDNGLSKLEKELRKMLDDILKEAEKVPSGLAKKNELPGNADKVFGEIVGMFNEIDKMVNGLNGKDEKKGFSDFVNGLRSMFSDVDSTKGNSFLRNLNKVAEEDGAADAHKLGMAQINSDTLSSLFKGGDTNTGFGINRIGDGGEGSGNFSAVNFMSDLSKNVNDGLENYRDAKGATEEEGEKKVNEANAVNAANQANAEAQFSTLA